MAYDLTTEQVDTLLAKLTSDKAFHAKFGADPAAALKSIGLPTTLAACVSGKTLASQAAIATAKASIQSVLVDAKTMAQHIHNLAAK